MKQLLYILLASTCLLSGELTAQEFAMALTGNNQPFPVLSTATGTISATLSGDTLKVSGSFDGVVSGVDTAIAGGAHIHLGLAGQSGGVVEALQPVLSEGLNGGMFEVASNTFILDAETRGALFDRKLYVNIHSQDEPTGELRAQLIQASEEVYTAHLFGSNHGVPVMSNASGMVILELNGTQATLSGSFAGLSSAVATEVAGGAHLHLGLAGQGGGVLQALTLSLNGDSTAAEILPGDNTFPLTDDDIAALRNEGVYVNVHSQNWTSGELRGQLTPVAQMKFRSHVTGANHGAPTNSFARGKLALGLRDGMLTVSGSFTGLESDLNVDILGGMHIHLGMAGRNGAVAFPLNVSLGTDNRSGTIDAAQNIFSVGGDTLMALMGRALYVNVHSIDITSGEIRGQILPESQYFLQADLLGPQEAPPVNSDGFGKAFVEILGDKMTVTGSYNNLGSPLATNIANGAHIHAAYAGSNGPLLVPLIPTNDGDNSGRWRAIDNQFDISDTRKDSLRARLGYINVHSENITSGELRGQLLSEALAFFYTPLSGSEEVPAVTSEATGAAIMEYTGTNAIVTGSFNGLGSAVNSMIAGGAHIHAGLPGQNGGVLTLLGLTLNDDNLGAQLRLSDNVYDVSAMYMDSVRQGMTYVNIHTINVGSGEIRGNFRPLAQNYYLANLRGKNAIPAASSTGRGSILFARNGANLYAVGAFENLEGDWATAIAGGAHVHFGMPGMAGGIALFMSGEASTDLKAATFSKDSNQWELPDSTLNMLLAGNTYVNIHSTTATPGEIRGQVLPQINFAPSTPAFSSPGSGDTIEISGDLSQAFTVTWDSVGDPDGDKVVYVWQLSLSEDFSAPALTVNTGDETQFTTTFGVVDTLLSMFEVDSGQAVTVYHRVAASDGSLCSSSVIDSVILVKGESTSLEENAYLDEVFRIFPNPTPDILQMDMVLKQSALADIQVIDLQGKVVFNRRAQLASGYNLIQYNMQRLSTGIYTVRMIIDQKIALAQPFIKQ